MFRKNQRKHVFINKSLQTRYLFYIALPLTLVVVATATAIYFGVWGSVIKEFSQDKIQSRLEMTTRLREYGDARQMEISEDSLPSLSMVKETHLFAAREKEILDEILRNTYKDIYPLFLGILFFICFGSIFITHKIAGPLFRFEASFQRLAEGDLNFRVHLRKGDEARNLVPAFNQFITQLDGSLYQIKESTLQLQQLMQEGDYPVECLEALAQMEYELDKYKVSRKVTRSS